MRPITVPRSIAHGKTGVFVAERSVFRSAAGAIVIALVVALTPTTAFSTSPEGETASDALPTTPMDAERRAAIDDIAQAAVSQPAPEGSTVAKVPGLWVGVWDPKLGAYTAAYGDAAASGPAATTADSFRIGSITKTFTAAVVLGLVADGKISLRGTVEQYLPDLAEQNPEIGDITVEQLLRMRSGIPDYANVPANGVVPQVTADPTKIWTTDELIAIGVDAGVKPGKPGYSTTNYLILGEIAEAVTGTPIETLITEQVATPLGLTQTVLPTPDLTAAPQPQSRGYVTDAAELIQDGGQVALGTDVTDWNSWGQAGGGMWSTLDELSAFAATDAGSSLLPRRLAKARLKTKDIGDGLQYGMGIMRWGPWVGHQGEALGYETWAMHNTKTGATYVASVNACCGATGVSALAPLFAIYPKDVKYFE
jgi:D-alanyl-D-alanine carboxypeptidase